MIVKTVGYRRSFSLGNYEHESFKVVIEVGPEDDVAAAWGQARAEVEAQHAMAESEREQALQRLQEEFEAELRQRWADIERHRAERSGRHY